MTKLCLKLACHYQGVSIFLKQHVCLISSFFGTQRQNTSATKGERRDWIQATVCETLI